MPSRICLTSLPSFSSYCKGTTRELVNKIRGELPKELLALKPHSKDFADLYGRWKLDLTKSQSTDEIMTALGIGKVQRLYMRKATPTTSIEPAVGPSGEEAVAIWTHLPLGFKKGGNMPMPSEEGGTVEFEQNDVNPVASWMSRIAFDEGCLWQERTGEPGTMMDVRFTSSANELIFLWGYRPVGADAFLWTKRVMNSVK